MWNRFRVTFALIAVLLSAAVGFADDQHHLILNQQDEVQAFELNLGLGTGKGYQTGTATGLISGTTFVDFRFTAAGAPVGGVLPIAFSNKVIITDIDGDQIFFDNVGTGSFNVGDPSSDFRGTGGPLRGTYVVTGATGKYRDWKVGSKYTYRAIATNPPLPGALGTVWVEVSSRRK